MMLLKLLSTIDRQRFSPSVITLTGGELQSRIEDLGFSVYNLNIKTEAIPVTGLFRLVCLLRQLQPDVLQGWMYHANLAAQIAAIFLRNKTPVVWNIRGTNTDLAQEKWMTAATIWLNAKLSGWPVKIINNSRNSVVQHEKILGFSATNTVIIPNGFDVEQFKPSPEAYQAIRNLLGLPSDTLLVGLIGRYHPMKDHGNFLRAVSLLSKTHPAVRFILAGTGVDASNGEVTSLVHELGFESSVVLLGRRDDIPEITAALDVACSSSSYGEGFSNAIGEAMSCGVPCVVTDVGDSAWIVGDTGKVVPPRDPVALAAGLRDLLDRDAVIRLALAERARQRIVDNFSLETVVRQYEVLYESLI